MVVVWRFSGEPRLPKLNPRWMSSSNWQASQPIQPTYSRNHSASVAQWDPVTVSVSANFGDLSWLPMPKYLSGHSYTATCVLVREGAPD